MGNYLYFNQIKTIICGHFKITEEFFMSKNRSALVVKARVLAMKLLRDKEETLQSIGDLFDKNHATIIHAINKHNDFIISDKGYKILYKRLQDKENLSHVINQIKYHEQEIQKLTKLLINK